MKKILSLVALMMLCIMGANAETVKYALSEGDTFTSGQTVEVKNAAGDVVATLTYGESGGDDFKTAKEATNIDGYTAFTEGNGVNGNKTGGTWYTITPKVDAKIAVAVVLNADKAFYIEEDGTALSDYNGIKVSEKFYGTYEFDAKAGKAYKFYCAGSKLGFFGFEMTIGGEEPPVVTNKNIILNATNWGASDARFAVYAFNSDEDYAWIDFAGTGVENTFATQVPDNFAKIILARMNGATTENNWDNRWNQTDDIDFTKIADGTIFTVSFEGDKSVYTTSNPLQEAKDKLTKVIELAEILDADALATEIAAAKEAAAGTDIEAMTTALNNLMIQAAPIAKELLKMGKEFANKYGYSDVNEAISEVESKLSSAISGDIEPLQTALNNLMAVALPAAQDAIGKFEGYAEVLDNEALNTAVADANAALKTGNLKAIVTAIKTLETPFLTAARAFVEKVKAENIEDAKVQGALAEVTEAMSASEPSIVAIGAAVQNLIIAYKAYQLEQNPVFTVAGTEALTGYNWDVTKNEMKLNAETGLYEWTSKLISVPGDYQFKVVKNYKVWYPEGDGTTNWVITSEYLGGDGAYIVTITFDAEKNEIGVSGVKREDPICPENNIYYWESPDGIAYENGGKAVHNNAAEGTTGRVNYLNAGYYTLCLNGAKDFSSDVITITLDEGNTLKAGDEIAITAYRNKEKAGQNSGAKLKFNDEKKTTLTIGDGLLFNNINTAAAVATEFGEPNTITATVPEEADGATTITMTRSQTGTNLFITKLVITRPETPTGINTVASAAQNAVIYNMAGQRVMNAQKGLYIINGKKVVIK